MILHLQLSLLFESLKRFIVIIIFINSAHSTFLEKNLSNLASKQANYGTVLCTFVPAVYS